VSNKSLENVVPFEESLQSDCELINDKLHFYCPEKRFDKGSGTHPTILQPLLLQYLLVHHKEDMHIYNIIDGFIAQVWDELLDVDFKRTKTGVFRCFTNTRFAANVLRHYGFLKFSKKEAYKTWKLSLAGFIVAAKVIKKNNWKLQKNQNHIGFNINPIITDTWKDIKDFNKFVQTLNNMCGEGVDFYKSFEVLLNEAYRLLGEYWKIIEDQELSQKEKLAQSGKKIKELESHTDIEKFYQEFRLHLVIEDLFQKATEQSG